MKSQVFIEKVLLTEQKRSKCDEKIAWKPWVLGALTLFIFASLSLYWLNEEALSRDSYWQSQQALFIWFNQLLQTILPASLWANLTKAGDALVLLPLLAFISIRQRKVWLSLMATVPFAGLTSVILKKLASIPRPGGVLEPEGWTIIGSMITGPSSFPSGHSLCAFAAFSAFLIAQHPKGKWLPFTLGLTIALLIALSRVAVGAHWPLDIIFGSALGCLAGLCGALLAQNCAWSSSASTKGRIISLSVLAMFAFSLGKEISSASSTEWVTWLAFFASLWCFIHLLFEDLFSIKITVLRHHRL